MPVIGLSPCRAMADFVESVKRTGGEPRELALTSRVPELLDGVDGVLLTGGGDVDPQLYGEAAHPTFGPAEPGRDRFEIALVRAAVAADIPLLGICRGMQVMNVALGGTLVQDVPSMVRGALDHSVREPRYALAHEIWIAERSRLWTCMREMLRAGDTCHVNSRHHQAVRALADGWQVTATSPDGVVEAMEHPGQLFSVAVQWHPENFWRTGEFRPLFEAFVEAAASRLPR